VINIYQSLSGQDLSPEMFQLACSFSILIDNVFLITGFNTFTCQCMSWWFSLWCLLWFIIHIASCMFLLCSIKNFTQLHAVIVQESYGNNCCDAKSNMKIQSCSKVCGLFSRFFNVFESHICSARM